MKFAPIFLGLFVASTVSAAAFSLYHNGWNDLNKDGEKNVYEDPTQPVAARVADLLPRLTLEEKIGQLWQLYLPEATNFSQSAEQVRAGTVGSYLGGSENIETPALRNQLQREAIEASRLGVPLIFAHDVIHGFRTIFPISLAQACAWEPELFEQTQTIAAREAAAAGIDWTFAPMVDLARDPRWGRIAEGFGEDPWLGTLNAAASVRGFQGTNVAAPDRVVACLKHYVGYGAAEGGRDYNTTEISEFTLRNFYLPQFQAGVKAGALTVMSAFNCISGFPASGHHHTLTEILRGEWQFPGFVVSDWESVGELVDHGVAADNAAAARLGLTAGVDMEMVSPTYHDTLAQQIKSGALPEAVLNQAVARILTVKFAKGLFENPFTDETQAATPFLRPDALALARTAAAKSCVLLKNENVALPLAKRAGKIALLGPFADNAEELIGCWSSRGHSNSIVSLADGIRAQLPAGAELIIRRGCRMIDAGKVRHHLDFSLVQEPPTGSHEIAEAVAVAQAANVILLALGEPREWSGEDASRTELGLPGRQLELFEAVAATGKPVIVVLFNGRPLAIPQLQEKAAAILEAWHPGIQGGLGVADVLLGEVAPAGRLTTTFPRSVGQVPFHYNHFNTGRPGFGDYKGNYADSPTTPLYPFGFGLAYTTFEFGKVILNTNRVPATGTVTAHVEITNTGKRAGTAVAELYLRALAATAGPRPVRELKGFQKITLLPGEKRAVQFELPAQELGYFDARGQWLVEAGKYQLWIAADSAAGEPAAFELTR